VYGPAQEDSSVECLRHTYLMSKEQFVNDILCKVMDEHTLILGDLNLKLNSNDDPINKSKAENLDQSYGRKELPGRLPRPGTR
jgi:hypothetical protein